MKKNLTKRDLLFFLLGVISIVMLNLALNWKSNVEAFQEGWDAAAKTVEQSQK